jgi:CheY-like chemotaxis protein
MKTAPVPTPNILIVDDNQDGLLVRRSLLEEVGCCVQIASSGDEGLKLYQSQIFDVVVTDYKMPGMNGSEFIQRLRLINPGARVVLLSGFVEPLGLTEQNTGADVVLIKSCNEPTQLVRSVKRLLSRPPRKPVVSQRDGRSLPAVAH